MRISMTALLYCDTEIKGLLIQHILCSANNLCSKRPNGSYAPVYSRTDLDASNLNIFEK